MFNCEVMSEFWQLLDANILCVDESSFSIVDVWGRVGHAKSMLKHKHFRNAFWALVWIGRDE